MMKLKITILLLAGLISMSVHAEIKSAFINPAKIMERAPQSINASQTLQNEFKDREQSLRDMAKEIGEMEKSYQTDSAIMSAEQKKKAEDQIIQKKRKFQFEQQAIKEDLQIRRSQLLKEVQKTISGVIRQYGATHGYDFIFTEGVAFASEKVDITDEILKELEK